MKLASMRSSNRDGKLVVVSRDLVRAVSAEGIAATLQEALDRWDDVEPRLGALYQRLTAGKAQGAFDLSAPDLVAPLPRAFQWLDGSTFKSHQQLIAAALGLQPAAMTVPLIYQGGSDVFFGGSDDVPFISEADGIDFEGEIGVIVDDVPMGTSAADAAKHIKLIVQINDWSLRELVNMEREIRLGWLQSKPPTTLAPVVVTPDELGSAWRDGRPDINLEIDLNGERFGRANAFHMHFSFPELIEYIVKRRSIRAGTIIGGGTVSNENCREVGSSCIGERRGVETIDSGAAKTSYMKFGDIVRMEAKTLEGETIFGTINSKVVAG